MRITKRQLRSIIREAVSRLDEKNEGATTITDLTWDPLDRPGSLNPAMWVAAGYGRGIWRYTPEEFSATVQGIVNRYGDVAIERVASEEDAHIKSGNGFWRIADPGWLAAQEAQEDYHQEGPYGRPGRYYGD